ncbi:hypothetical protein FKM82_008200 [Ascaphus truei]
MSAHHFTLDSQGEAGRHKGGGRHRQVPKGGGFGNPMLIELVRLSSYTILYSPRLLISDRCSNLPNSCRQKVKSSRELCPNICGKSCHGENN